MFKLYLILINQINLRNLSFILIYHNDLDFILFLNDNFFKFSMPTYSGSLGSSGSSESDRSILVSSDITNEALTLTPFCGH